MELLIRTVDKHPAESAEYERASQRGDVICAVADGWEWSAAERENPEWIIIRADITQIEIDALMEPGRTGEPQYRRRVGVNTEGLLAGDLLTREQLMARVF